MSELKEKLIESIIHSSIIMIISLFITYLIIINLSSILWISMISIIGVIFLITYIKKPYKKEEYLVINSWLCKVFIIFIGCLIGKIIPLSSLIGFSIGISIFDIISFIKIGSKTANAKVMANKNLMARLIVYGKSFKNNNAIPTKGLGDFLFYTILLSGIYKVSDNSNFVLYGTCLIFLGCAINWIIVCFIYNKKWYRGFLATFIPLISVLPLFLKLVN